MTPIFGIDGIKETIDALKWLSTLGASEVKNVKKEIEELIRLISESLLSFHDLSKEITQVDAQTLTASSFRSVHDYFRNYYFGQENISKTRTHCGDVKRQLGKIKSKLSLLLHTDLGKWQEAEIQFRNITTGDAAILREFEMAMDTLDKRCKGIEKLFIDDKAQEARASYSELRDTINNELEGINEGVKMMRKTYDHIQGVVG